MSAVTGFQFAMTSVLPGRKPPRVTGCFGPCKALPALWGSVRFSSSSSTCHPMHNHCSSAPRIVEDVAAAGTRCSCPKGKEHLIDAGKDSASLRRCGRTRMVPPTLFLGFPDLKSEVQMGRSKKPLARLDLATVGLVRLVVASVGCSRRPLEDKRRTRHPHTQQRSRTRYSGRWPWTQRSRLDGGPWRGSILGVSLRPGEVMRPLAPSNRKGQARRWRKSYSVVRPDRGRDSPKKKFPMDNTFSEWRPANVSRVV